MTSTPQSRFCAARVRQDFLDFFAERGHRIVPSGPVFPQDDPTLLFTNAGMNQFKDVFLGTGTRDYKRAVDTQKCIRVSGKHNDLEEVGVDTYHHTFFEMLGNWSFGDYFKEEAIGWSWDLLTKTWGIDPSRLWVTVFAGDQKDGLPADEDAARIWIEKAGVHPSRVLRFGRKANFWEMGDTGPCGPCTEIHIDRGGPNTNPNDGADPKIGVNVGNERFIELWNNVFMQFNRLEDGRLVELPAKSVDTGMGFERILSVLQKKSSNYDTDLFLPIFARIEHLTGKRYEGGTSQRDVAFRVIADHTRAVTSAFADGALPGNEGRGYVMRRLIRRASRFGRQALGHKEPFIHEVVPAVAEVLGDAFPEMRARREHVQLLVKSEEESFGKTLDRGLVLFDNLTAKLSKAHSKTIDGADAYELYATFGFPQDLVELMARERSLNVDMSGWERAKAAHQAASKSDGTFKQLFSSDDLKVLEEQFKALEPKLQGLGWKSGTHSTYHEVGPRSTQLETYMVHISTGVATGIGTRVVLAESPFYPEGGGQAGDTGYIEAVGPVGPDAQFRFDVTDTKRFGALVVHLGTWRKGLIPGQALRVVAHVDEARRAQTKKNHTATHLMHRALKEVLGQHVAQQGSYVGPDRLRFDFSHPKGVSPEDLERVETIVNAQIERNDAVKTTVEDLDAARARGVVAMFGEKYDAQVRVLDVGGWSLELCGGTHVRAAGDIGPFVILSERAVQAGVRRIEAVTGPAAVEYIQSQRRLVREVAQSLKSSVEEIPLRIEQLQTQLKEARKKSAASAGGDVAASFETLKGALKKVGDAHVAVLDFEDLDQAGVRDLLDRAKSLHPKLALAVFGREEGRVPFAIACPGLSPKPLNAGAIAKAVSTHLGGGGGGKPDLAQGQGQNPAGIAAALAEVERAFAVLT